MSPSVGNFVHDLVEMAKAMETLPQVQHELDDAVEKNNRLAQDVQSREESILKLKAEIEALQSRVRDAEVARDDAELRFLELDEKAGKVLSSLGNIQANLNDAVAGLTPPKPEPQPIPEWNKPVVDIPLAPLPNISELSYPANQVAAEAPQGQSESNPTQAQEHPTGTTMEPVASSSKLYEGKFYHDHPVYLTLHDWLDGGGTEENYYRNKPRDNDPTHVPF